MSEQPDKHLTSDASDSPSSEPRVRSWSELLDVLHSAEIAPRQPSQGNHYRSPYVFRGMSDSTWPLKTSLERLESPPQAVEPALLRSFRKYAPRGTFAADSDWEALSVAQHNGLPTRVLDWSVSPLVGAHFATCEREHYSKHGVIWCIDVIALRDRILPAEIARTIQSAPAAVFDVTLLQRAYPTLSAFDATQPMLGEACVFFEPPSIDSRISNQFGILSAMNGPAMSHDQYFKKIGDAYPGVVRRVVIDCAAKPQVRDMLDQNNINERMLFPGLPGLCDWLKRYYGPAAAPRSTEAAAGL